MSDNRIMGGWLSAILVIIAMAVYPSPAAPSMNKQAEFREYTSQGNYFRCSVPRGWSEYHQSFGLSQEEKKVYGVTLFGPSDGGPVPPTISLHYYAPEISCTGRWTSSYGAIPSPSLVLRQKVDLMERCVLSPSRAGRP